MELRIGNYKFTKRENGNLEIELRSMVEVFHDKTIWPHRVTHMYDHEETANRETFTPEEAKQLAQWLNQKGK